MNTHIYNILHIYVYPTNKLLIMLINLNPHLRGRGTTVYDTHSFEWPFLLKFLCTKIVKQFVFLVQSIVFTHMFLNL